jgi:hypothetical protein
MADRMQRPATDKPAPGWPVPRRFPLISSGMTCDVPAVDGTVALRHPCARQGMITRMLRRSYGDSEVIEDDTEPVAAGDSVAMS